MFSHVLFCIIIILTSLNVLVIGRVTMLFVLWNWPWIDENNI